MAFMSAGIIRHRKLVLILFILAAVLCAVLQLGVSVNYNMTDYLPENAQSTQALSIIQGEFTDAVPNARVMLHGVSVQEALEYKQRLGSIDGVSDVLWLDDVIDLKKPLELADTGTVENYYKDGNALLSLTIKEGSEVRVTDEIYGVIGDDNALSGSAVNMGDAQKLTGSETQTAMIILVPVIILILLLTTRSWLEPVLYLLSIGISVLINMGTNLIFGEISFMTNAISPILQLAVSLDYAIFLLHSFEDFRKETDDIHEAMRLAMKRAFSSIAASAATTLFGFLALVFMKFGIGSDLGIVLVKGIILSFLSVMVFLPALALCSYKLIDKTRHRKLFPEFKGIGKVVSKVRIPALILVILLIVPAYLAQSRNDFAYGTSKLSETSRSGLDTAAINEEFGQSTVIVLLVPRGDIAKEAQLSGDLKTLDHVTEVISYASTVGTRIPDAFLDDSVTNRFYSDHYSRIIVYTDTPDEGETAFSVVEQVQATARSYYGDTVYSTGQSVTLYDMKTVITADNKNVNLIAIVSILVVLLITFKSASLPLILLVTIETAIWLNLSAPYFSGNKLIYIGYLILNTVQLGATVDYAILLTNHYVRNRQLQPKKEAMKTALGEAFGPILTSATILALAGFALKWTSSNPIVSEMGLLLGRGTILSFLLVILFLPAALTVFDKLIQKTTIRLGFHRE